MKIPPGGAPGYTNPVLIGPSQQQTQQINNATVTFGPQRYSTGLVSEYGHHHQYAAHHPQQHHRHNHSHGYNHGHHHQQHYNDTQSSVTMSLPLTPPDDRTYHDGGSYFHPGQFDNSTGTPSVTSPSPPSASSSAIIAYRPGQVYSPTQTHDCYGVPAHPSVADFVSPSQAQYHVQSQLPYGLRQSELLHNNNNNYLPLLPYGHLEDFKPVKTIAGNNSSRQMRNLAEKHRRKKLNTCIEDLARLVPLISGSSRKYEKTSVLRLSASYLRLNQVLMGINQLEELPNYMMKVNLADLVLDERDIYLLVTSGGKIVFVSYSVEKILGHSQIDLMGQSLLNITCPEDHDTLRNNLKYHGDKLSSNNSNEDDVKGARRSFYVRLVKKAVSRNEQPDLELVYVVGSFIKMNAGSKNSTPGGNNVILNAIVRPCIERRVTEVSIMEATREEYITRHQLDSRIIYVDHRISIVSGFMPQEVSGQLAFTYMHKDDVRWVMIALRQMYIKGQSYGKSCYRLLSKNGEFVYMSTHGYLELNPLEDSVQSFMCVNSLVSSEEGKKEIQQMRERFTPIIRTQPEPGIAAITNNQFMEADSTTSLIHGSTEDPKTINKVVEQMISNIPAPAIDNVKETAQNPLPDTQFIKVKLMSESMPPVPSSFNTPKIDKRSSMSPQPNLKPPTQDRPSVLMLRVTPPIARTPVVVYKQHTNEKITETDREYLERRGGILVPPKRHNELSLISEHSPKKAKVILETQIDSPTCSQYSNQMDGSQSDYQLSTDGNGSLDDFSSFQNTPINEHDIDLDTLSDVNMTCLETFTKSLDDTDTLTPGDPLFLTPESYSSYDTGIYNEGNSTDIIQDSLMHVLQQDGSVESDLLEKKQNTLKTKMDQQEGQLKEIQTELNALSSNADTHYLNTNLSNLKAAHEQQRQILRTLKGAHQNIGV